MKSKVPASIELLDTDPRAGRRKPKATVTTEDEANQNLKQAAKIGGGSDELVTKEKHEKFIEPPEKQADAILRQSYVVGTIGKVLLIISKQWEL